MKKKTERILINIQLYIFIIFGGLAIDFGEIMFGVLLVGICSYYVGRRHQEDFALSLEGGKQ